MRLFSPDWAQALEAELGQDQRFLQSARLLRAVIRWHSPAGGVDLVVGPGRVTVAPARLADGFDFGLTATEAVWLELFSQPRVGLNQLVRRGDISLTGDRVAVLLWWKPVFLMAQAGRRLNGWGSEFAAAPAKELKKASDPGLQDEPEAGLRKTSELWLPDEPAAGLTDEPVSELANKLEEAV
ncbi:MAG: hypothetical protein LBK54_00655 [Propionibacteriaceae bacterium]|jgi:hypothetical protein|nr:hypothetical protein [Propionibacteriaceae bacterium]